MVQGRCYYQGPLLMNLLLLIPNRLNAFLELDPKGQFEFSTLCSRFSRMPDTCAVRIDFIDSRVGGPDNRGRCATDKIDFM